MQWHHARIIAGATRTPCSEHPLLSQIEKLIPDNQVICQSGKPHAFIRMAHAFLEGIAAVHSLFWRFVGGKHVHPLRSRERRCFLVVQTLWAEKIQSTTDAGSLNTFGPNEVEVAPISSALLRIACLVILYKTCRVPDQELAADGVSAELRPSACVRYQTVIAFRVDVIRLSSG